MPKGMTGGGVSSRGVLSNYLLLGMGFRRGG